MYQIIIIVSIQEQNIMHLRISTAESLQITTCKDIEKLILIKTDNVEERLMGLNK